MSTPRDALLRDAAARLDAAGVPDPNREARLILRWAVLKSGTLPTWRAGGFEFRRVARPKEPKPSMGLMPPS